MLQFARWVAERDYRAALMAAGLALLPLLAVVSCAVLALVSLQRGAAAGWRTAAFAAALLALVAWSAGVPPAAGVIPALAVWLPSVALAQVLSATGSLSLAARLAAGGAVLLAVAWAAAGPAPGDAWREAVATMAEQFAAGTGIPPGELAQRVLDLVPGIMAGSVLLASLLGLFLGMWLHAGLTRPGAFGEAFRSLQLGPVIGAVGALAAVAGVASGSPVAIAAAIPAATALGIQGLATLHGLAHARGWHRGWLVAAWSALFLASPWAAFGFALYGTVDSFVDFRRRPA
ncbi:MAG: hypothetical protein P8080_12275 [Gammaproteobacteria bacterium]